MFKNIFESYPKIPETIKKDPSKIIDYVNAQDKAKDVMSNLDKEGASTIVGAKEEDYEYLGYKKTSSGASLSQRLKEKGGRMDMKDLLETMT
jgi:D-arabinose 1-dehydrogenase-like Zn-dependent alcohol dehydrogenase